MEHILCAIILKNVQISGLINTLRTDSSTKLKMLFLSSSGTLFQSVYIIFKIVLMLLDIDTTAHKTYSISVWDAILLSNTSAVLQS